MEIKNILRILGRTVSKNGPTILTGLSVAGLITTTLSAIKAGPKALDVLDNYKWELYTSKHME
jgi:hypothetical protein